MPFQGAVKYPSDLTQGGGPHEKWILLEARAGRHIARDGFVAGEATEPDRTLASVALYLPTDALKSGMTVNYKDVDLGMAAGKAIEETARTGRLNPGTAGAGGGGWMDNLKNIAAHGGVGFIGAKALGAIETAGKAVVDDPRATIEVLAGKAVNPRTDTMFNAVQYRTHEFTFNLIPRDKEEADNIDAILNILHYYSLPDYGDNANLWNFMIGYPYEFVITMFNQTHINKIQRSVLTGLTVDHAGGDRIAFATDYYPAATALTLSFKEVRLLGRDSGVILRGGGRAGIGDDPRRDGPGDEEIGVSDAAGLASSFTGLANEISDFFTTPEE